MFKNQKGIAIVEVLLVMVIIGIIGGTGWYVYQQQKETKPTTQNQQIENNEEETNNSDESSEVTRLLDREIITLINPEDISKLDSRFPESFVEHFEEKLANNKPDENGCIEKYDINKISDVNIGGGVGSVYPDGTTGAGCGGGANVVWYSSAGRWQELGYQSVLLCSTFKEATIYAEFMDTCLEGDDMVPNPNGSIKDRT